MPLYLSKAASIFSKMIEHFQIFAQPWWVNLLILMPIISFYAFRKGLQISRQALLSAATFGIAFGFVEAAAVVYLRAAVGLLPGYGGTLADVANFSGSIFQQAQILAQLPKNLLAMEVLREIATMIMLVSIALLSAKKFKERCAIFLLTFAAWDIFYYVWLWAAARWPQSLLTQDVLFLIPTPWISQVWFPVLVSVLVILAVIINTKSTTDGRFT